jgi:uncharacterized protein YggE
MSRFIAFALLAAVSVPVSAQQITASLDQLAASPVVTVQISEQLRSQPDEATINAGTESHAATASAALAANKLKTEHLIEAPGSPRRTFRPRASRSAPTISSKP